MTNERLIRLEKFVSDAVKVEFDGRQTSFAAKHEISRQQIQRLLSGHLKHVPAWADGLLRSYGLTAAELNSAVAWSKALERIRSTAGWNAADLGDGLVGEWTTFSIELARKTNVVVSSCKVERKAADTSSLIFRQKFKKAEDGGDHFGIGSIKIHGRIAWFYGDMQYVGDDPYRSDPYVFAVPLDIREVGQQLHGIVVADAGRQPYYPSATRISLFRRGAQGGAFDLPVGKHQIGSLPDSILEFLQPAIVLKSWTT